MANKRQKCKKCGQHGDVNDMIKRGLSYFCTTESAIQYTISLANKARDKLARKAAKEVKKKHRADKERIKPRSKWLAEAQAAFNKYVRARDKGLPCCSCDKPDNGLHQRHASHYKSVGSNSALRFNLFNVNSSCMTCNTIFSGRIDGYIPRLIEKIGQEKYDWLLTQNHTVKYEIEYLKRLKRIFNKRARLKLARF